MKSTLQEISDTISASCGWEGADHVDVTVHSAGSVWAARAVQRCSRKGERRSSNWTAFSRGLATKKWTMLEKTTGAEQRKKTTFGYTVLGREVCRTVFCFVFQVSWFYSLDAVAGACSQRVCFPGSYGSSKCVPVNAYRTEVKAGVVEFLSNFLLSTHCQCRLLRGHAEAAPVCLPASMMYATVQAKYVEAQAEGQQLMKLK